MFVFFFSDVESLFHRLQTKPMQTNEIKAHVHLQKKTAYVWQQGFIFFEKKSYCLVTDNSD